MTVARVAGVVLLLALAGRAGAQDLGVDVSATAGVSTDDLAAAATQVRLSGDVGRFTVFAEGAWSASSLDEHQSSEAFATAYPYDGPPRLMDAYVERRIGDDRLFASVRGGRFRTPFGIHTASDHAYNGFLRAPLIRYEGYWALTNTLFEHGVNVLAGTSRLQAELSVGRPSDVGDVYTRRPGTDVVMRAQTWWGPFVVGATHMRSAAYDLDYAEGRLALTGIDVRVMHAGVQVRGEWIYGRPWDGTRTTGGYADVIVHRPFMGPVTLVGRLEHLDYDTGDPAFNDAASGLAVGTRIKLIESLYAQANVTHRPSEPYARNATATDVALTYTVRYRR